MAAEDSQGKTMPDSISAAAGEAYRAMYREARDRVVELEAALGNIARGQSIMNPETRRFYTSREIAQRALKGKKWRMEYVGEST